MSTKVPVQRTDTSIRKNMISVSTKSLDNIKGVKGVSFLSELNGFDLSCGMVVDYMHAVLLGVVQQHTEILLTSVGTEYYIGNYNFIRIISHRNVLSSSLLTREVFPV